MGKLKKRKDDKVIGKQMPSAYELNKLQQEEGQIALEKAQKMERPIKYLLSKVI
jgi:hypothetical protein